MSCRSRIYAFTVGVPIVTADAASYECIMVGKSKVTCDFFKVINIGNIVLMDIVGDIVG